MSNLLNNAIYIQYPMYNEKYYNYDNDICNIHKLPLWPNLNNTYNNWPGNEHHYTTQYNIKEVLPLLNSIFRFGYNRNDFNMHQYIYDGNDLSYIVPKIPINYTIHSYSYNITTTGNYDELVQNYSIKTLNNTTSYHQLYIFPHQCSRIINNTIANKRILFINGDSQILPCIMPLSVYYKEIYYFDNRLFGINVDFDTAPYMSNNIENVVFDDILVALYANPIEKYTKINMK